MKPHLRYLRYVLLHKWYVFRAGLAIAALREKSPLGWVAWVWRLLIHDASKFRPSEWRPYVAHFYGPSPEHQATLDHLATGVDIGVRRAQLMRDGMAAFNYAWLAHIHRNPHHWQHWLLREDSGKQLVLLMPADLADEMTADWIGAGQKILQGPTLTHCVVETITWYVKNKDIMQLREPVRLRVEENLWHLAADRGIMDAALEINQAQLSRVRVEIPGR